MWRVGGYCYSVGPLGVENEADTFTCFHCNTVVKVKPKCDPAEIGGMCKICMKMICPSCVGMGCKPFSKKLEEWEARDLARRSYGF